MDNCSSLLIDLPASTMNPSNLPAKTICLKWKSDHVTFPAQNPSLDFHSSWDKHPNPHCGLRASSGSSVMFFSCLPLPCWVTATFAFLQFTPKPCLLPSTQDVPFAWNILSPIMPPSTYLTTTQMSHFGGSKPCLNLQTYSHSPFYTCILFYFFIELIQL